MVDKQVAQGGHPAMDYAEHEATYQLFLKLSKWVLIFCILLLIFMAVTLL